MSDFIGKNWRTMGSCRGSAQLTRLRIYGLPRLLAYARVAAGSHQDSRHTDGHGGSSHAVEDILDELFAGLDL